MQREKQPKTAEKAAALEKGLQSEAMVLTAIGIFQEKPEWFAAVRAATSEEDHHGIDIVVATEDVGDLFVQVKSSMAEALRYLDKKTEKELVEPVAIVCPLQFDSQEELGRKIFDRLAEMRGEMLELGSREEWLELQTLLKPEERTCLRLVETVSKARRRVMDAFRDVRERPTWMIDCREPLEEETPAHIVFETTRADIYLWVYFDREEAFARRQKIAQHGSMSEIALPLRYEWSDEEIRLVILNELKALRRHLEPRERVQEAVVIGRIGHSDEGSPVIELDRPAWLLRLRKSTDAEYPAALVAETSSNERFFIELDAAKYSAGSHEDPHFIRLHVPEGTDETTFRSLLYGAIGRGRQASRRRRKPRFHTQDETEPPESQVA